MIVKDAVKARLVIFDLRTEQNTPPISIAIIFRLPIRTSICFNSQNRSKFTCHCHTLSFRVPIYGLPAVNVQKLQEKSRKLIKNTSICVKNNFILTIIVRQVNFLKMYIQSAIFNVKLRNG